MARSPTPKKSETNTLVDRVVEYGLTRVSEWTKAEFSNLRKNSKLPICVQLDNGNYIVATYLVEKSCSNHWQVGSMIFSDKRSAIFYCALSHLGKTVQADEIRQLDERVGKIAADRNLFRDRLDKAHESGGQFKIDLYSSRYSESKTLLDQAKQDLEKIFARTKYIEALSRNPLT